MTPPVELLFGTAGVPQSTLGTSTLQGLSTVAALDLDCLEVEFVKGIKMGQDMARKIGDKAKSLGLSLSVHAPYYINLNSPEQGKRLASQERLLASARLAELCGARSVVFHPGFYGRDSQEKTYETIKKGIREVASILRTERNPVTLRPETMGKKSQFGSLEEILFLCREIDGIAPCFDFSHIYAREGRSNDYNEFHRILRKIEKKLGRSALDNIHIHISGVEFSDKGEIRHLNLHDCDFRYDDWIQALKDFDVKGLVICESPTQEKDALMLKKLFHSR
jgi:deoxyribonuclease-4